MCRALTGSLSTAFVLGVDRSIHERSGMNRLNVQRHDRIIWIISIAWISFKDIFQKWQPGYKYRFSKYLALTPDATASCKSIVQMRKLKLKSRWKLWQLRLGMRITHNHSSLKAGMSAVVSAMFRSVAQYLKRHRSSQIMTGPHTRYGEQCDELVAQDLPWAICSAPVAVPTWPGCGVRHARRGFTQQCS